MGRFGLESGAAIAATLEQGGGNWQSRVRADRLCGAAALPIGSAPMRTPLRTLLIILVLLILAVVILSFVPHDRPVRTIEQDVTNTLGAG